MPTTSPPSLTKPQHQPLQDTRYSRYSKNSPHPAAASSPERSTEVGLTTSLELQLGAAQIDY